MQVTSQYKNNDEIPKRSGRLMPWILRLGGLFEHKIDHHPEKTQRIPYRYEETIKWQPDFMWNIRHELLTRYFKCVTLLSASVLTHSVYLLYRMDEYRDALALGLIMSICPFHDIRSFLC